MLEPVVAYNRAAQFRKFFRGDAAFAKRKIGGQPGHAKHEREPFPAERIDQTIDYELAEPGS